MKRYNLVMPEELYNELKAVSDKKQLTVVDVMRNFIKLGLLVDKLNDEGAEIIIRQGATEKQIIFPW